MRERLAVAPERRSEAEGAPSMGLLSTSVGYALKRAYLRVYDDFLLALGDLELRPQLFSALSLIVDNPGIIQSALARVLAIERSNIVLLVDELDRRGFITRNPVPSDRRAYALRATEAGRLCRREAAIRIAAHEKRMLSRLSDAEQRGLIDLLARVGSLPVEAGPALRLSERAGP